MNRKYETIFVLNPQMEEEQAKAMAEKFKELIEAQAQFEKVEEWGKKRLAYEVNKMKEGYYFLMHFSADAQFPTELERHYKITEDVLKYIIIKLDQ